MEEVNRRRGLSSSFLKMTAVILMIIDHFGLFIIAAFAGRWIESGQPGEGYFHFAYDVMRTAGRLAFPIFAFLIVEGFLHTRSVRKYTLRLGLFALLSEIPFDLALFNKVFSIEGQNVMFTLLFGLLALICLKYLKGNPFLQILGVLLVLLCLAATGILRTDYGWLGAAFIPLFYLLHDKPILKFTGGSLLLLCLGIEEFLLYGEIAGLTFGAAAALCALSCVVPLAGTLSFPLLHAYNGERGMRLPKYFFYAFYPVQFLLFWGIGLWIG